MVRVGAKVRVWVRIRVKVRVRVRARVTVRLRERLGVAVVRVREKVPQASLPLPLRNGGHVAQSSLELGDLFRSVFPHTSTHTHRQP